MALLKPEHVTHTPFKPGDVGIVLQADGNFRIFRQEGAIDANNLTPEQLEQGRKLRALALALQVPAVMEVLHQFASDPAISAAALDLGSLQ